jgi:2-phospho-L-lactate guanylyltransferase
MRTIAILPVKRFGDAKQRLASDLSPGVRRALAEAMFSDVLVALRRSQAIDGSLVVSSDHGAQQIAGGYGALVLGDLEEGHNPAARRGIIAAIEDGAERVVLVPGDCPLLSPQELDELLARPMERSSVLVVPDRHGTGTNALVLHPADALAPAFGPDSCQRHLAAGQEAGLFTRVAEVPTLAIDVDTAEDLVALQDALAASHGGAAHTRGMLRQLLRSQE